MNHKARPLTFLAGFLKHPREVGSVIPSSRSLIRRIVRHGDVSSARVVVELGPGTGVVTKQMLRHMRPDARLIALEINPLYIKTLQRDIQDPRFSIHAGPATEIQQALQTVGEHEVDLVVSGIPFSTLPKPEARRTLQRLNDRLSPDGRFVAYQFRSEVRKLGEPILGPATVRAGYWNFPPMRIFIWRRSDAVALA